MRTSIKGLGDIGVITDRDAHDIPINAFDSLIDVRCKHGRIQAIDGYSDLTAVSEPDTTKDVHIHMLINAELNETNLIVYAYDDDDDGQAETLKTWNGAAVNDITRAAGATPYTGTADDLWQACAFNDHVVFTNGIDAPQSYAGTGDAANLTFDGTNDWEDYDGGGSTYAAKVLRGHGSYLFAIDIDDNGTRYPTMVHWSSPATPGAMPTSWEYDQTDEDSRRVVCSDTDGYAVDGLSLGDQFILYKEDAIYRFSFVGGRYVWDKDLVTTSHGIWAANCVVDVGEDFGHVVLGKRSIYVFNGGLPKDLIWGRAAKAFFDQIDPDEYQKAFLTHNKAEREVWICYPEVGETWCTKALIWNYADNTWYYRNLPPCSMIIPAVVTDTDDQAWDAESSDAWDAETDLAWVERAYSPVADTMVAGEQQLIQFGVGRSSEAVAQRTNIVPASPDDWTQLRTALPFSTGGSFTLQFGTQDVIDGAVTWETGQTFDPGTDYKQDERVSGRVYAYRVLFNGNDGKLSGMDLDTVPVGRR